MAEDELKYDFVCIGGGLGGLAAALRAHELGMSVLILERSSLLGGVAAYSGGTVWAPNNHLASAAGLADSIDAANTYLDAIAPQQIEHDAKLRDAFLRTIPYAIRFFTEVCGIPFSVSGRPDHFFPSAEGSVRSGRALEVAVEGAGIAELASIVRTTPHFRYRFSHREVAENGGPAVAYRYLAASEDQRVQSDYRALGPGLVLAFAKAAIAERRIAVLRNVRVSRLLVDGNRVVGVEGDSDGRILTVGARRGVLLACGSYGSANDAAMMEGLPEVVEASPPVIDGDGLALLEQVPAAVTRSGRVITALGFFPPGFVHEDTDVPLCMQLSLRATALPHSIVVNRLGERFADESFYRLLDNRVKFFDSMSGDFPNFPCYMIVDNSFRQSYGLLPNGEWPEGLPQAGTLEDLARQLGIDAGGLSGTVQRYNAFCESGVDEEFRRGETPQGRAMGDPDFADNPTMGPLDNPPYWGIRLHLLGTGVYTMGARIDHDARVVDRKGSAVPGLYATGNAVAYTESQGYTGGQANARNLVFSYLAANAAFRDEQAERASH